MQSGARRNHAGNAATARSPPSAAKCDALTAPGAIGCARSNDARRIGRLGGASDARAVRPRSLGAATASGTGACSGSARCTTAEPTLETIGRLAVRFVRAEQALARESTEVHHADQIAAWESLYVTVEEYGAKVAPMEEP